MIRSGIMTVKTKSRSLINPKIESLEDYVGSRSSQEIIQNLNQLDDQEIKEFKDSLETIFRLISADTQYH
jgi:hypothetical protein